MPVSVGNIIQGAANFFEGDAASLTDLGATQGGVSLALGGNEFARIEVDQMRGIADMEQVMQNYLIRTTLAEPTLANLTVAFNKQETATVSVATGDLFSIEDEYRHERDSTTKYRKVVFVGPAPGTNKHRSFVSNQNVSIGTPEQTYVRGEGTVIPIEFEIVPEARTYLASMHVKESIDTQYVVVDSVCGSATTDTSVHSIAANILIGGIITDINNSESRAIIDNTLVASSAAAVGTLTVAPTWTTTPAAADVMLLEANRAALWATIRDV